MAMLIIGTGGRRDFLRVFRCVVALVLVCVSGEAGAGVPVLPAQTNRAVNELTVLVVANTATTSWPAIQWLTNTYKFTYGSRLALTNDGWSFIATQPGGAPRDTEVSNPADPAAVSYDQSAHPGVLRIPCTAGDLYMTANNSTNSLFRSLPANWLSARLNLSFSPAQNYQQAHLALYQDDDNYAQVGIAYNSFSGGLRAAVDIETDGNASGQSMNLSSGGNINLRLDRSVTSGAITGLYSLDGTNWMTIGTVSQAFVNPRLGIWTGGGGIDVMPAVDLRRMDIVVSNAVPLVLSYELLVPPAGASIDANGVVTWTPSEAQGPGTNTITTIVTDNGVPALSATNTFVVVVNEINTPPVLPVQTDRTLTGQQALLVTNTAGDADIPTNSLSYQLTGAPAGAAIAMNGVITWTPTVGHVPSTNVFATVVTDFNPWALNTQRLSATNSFRVVVTADTTCTNEITFCDTNLQAVVRAALSKPIGPITRCDMLGLESLSASGRNITNLCGLEWAMNLSSLELEQNPFSDLSPLAGLRNLRCLSLGRNQVTDYSAVSNLTGLASLAVRTGNLRDLSVLKPLTQLTSLTLSENGIFNISLLSGLTNLVSLDLRWNWITDCSALLNGPANLTSLYLSGNHITTLPDFQPLQQLRLLALDENGLSSIAPLIGSSNLTYLSLSRNPITNLSVLAQLGGLANLELRGNSISNLDFLTSLRRLNYADLAYNSITNIAPLLGLTNLNSLVLAGNPLTDYGDLSGMASVSNLWLFGNSINDANVVADLGWLNYLDLGENQITDVSPLLSLVNLSGLSLSRNPITDCGPFAALTGLAGLRLEHMRIGTNAVSDISALTNLNQLRFLSLSQNQISDLRPLAGLTNLQDLYLRRNEIADISTLTNLQELRNVDVSLNFLDLSPGSSASGVIQSLQLRTNVVLGCGCESVTNRASGLQWKQVSLTYLPTNTPPTISIPLITPWYVPEGALSSLNVSVSEGSTTEAEFVVPVSYVNPPENPSLVLISDVVVPGDGATRVLTLLAGWGDDERASVHLTVIDDVGQTNSTTVQVIVKTPIPVTDLSPSSDPRLLMNLGQACEKPIADLTVVDLLMLTNLFVDNADVTSFAAWPSVSNLRELFLYGNVITNLSFVTNLVHLRTLVLRNTLVSDLLPIGTLSGLVDLEVAGNSLAGMDGMLTTLTNLVSLSLMDNIVSNMCSLGSAAGITSLQLNGNRLTDISCLSGFTNLKYLDLQQNMLTDISVLTNLALLSTVDLRYDLLDTNSSAVMGVIASLTNRGAMVEYMPQRAAPIIFILTNYIVAAGWPNTIGYYMQENGANCSTGVTNDFYSDHPDVIPTDTNHVSASFTNTASDWIEWRLIVTPIDVTSNTNVGLWLFATNDVGQVGSNYTTLTVTKPLSLAGDVFSGRNLVWRTGGDAPWFGQTVITHLSAPAAQSGGIGSLQASWLEADIVGPGILSFWWKVSSHHGGDKLTFEWLQQSINILGEVDWQQQFVSIPPGTNTVQWQYAKDDRLGGGLDAGWVADVTFIPLSWLTVIGQRTNGGLVLSWPGSGTFQPATNISAPWFQMATNVSGPWLDYMSATNSPLLITPSNLIPAQFFRLRL
jgi:internalin A